MSSFDKKTTPPSIEKENESDACIDALLYSNFLVFHMVLDAAIKLEVFEIMGKAGPNAQISASEIASQLPTKNPDAASLLDRMLNLLASHSLLSFSLHNYEDGRVEKVYGLTPSCKLFLKDNSEGSLAHIVSFTSHPAILNVWSNMKDVILEGGNLFERVHGMSIFQYMDNDPNFNNTFNSAMASIAIFIMNQVLAIYKGYEGVKTLVDVGGGNGKSLQMIISKYPSIKGINFDLPFVVESSPSYPGIEHVGGSMFSSIPTADAIMVKDVLHNWGDEDVVKIIKKCYEALPTGGKLIIINPIMPEKPESNKASMYVPRLDNIMLAIPSGKERTAKQFESLCKKAGFSNLQVVCVAQGVWGAMEAYK